MWLEKDKCYFCGKIGPCGAWTCDGGLLAVCHDCAKGDLVRLMADSLLGQYEAEHVYPCGMRVMPEITTLFWQTATALCRNPVTDRDPTKDRDPENKLVEN